MIFWTGLSDVIEGHWFGWASFNWEHDIQVGVCKNKIFTYRWLIEALSELQSYPGINTHTQGRRVDELLVRSSCNALINPSSTHGKSIFTVGRM
jgi:hypothetical protein